MFSVVFWFDRFVASCASTIARSSWSSCSASSSRTRVSNSSTRASQHPPTNRQQIVMSRCQIRSIGSIGL